MDRNANCFFFGNMSQIHQLSQQPGNIGGGGEAYSNPICGGRLKSPFLFSGGGATFSDGEGDDEGIESDGSGGSISSASFGDETGLFDGIGV